MDGSEAIFQSVYLHRRFGRDEYHSGPRNSEGKSDDVTHFMGGSSQDGSLADVGIEYVESLIHLHTGTTVFSTRARLSQ